MAYVETRAVIYTLIIIYLMDNDKYIKYFAQPMEIEHWKWVIENLVGPWVAAHGKSYWEFVKFVSQRRRVLKTIGREKFADLLLYYFPSLFKPSDTAMSLKYDMDKFRYNNILYNYSYDKDKEIHTLEKELNELFDTEMESSNTTMTSIPTMQSRLEEYLYKIVDKSMYAKIVNRPTYCNFTATYSIEQYMTKAFFNQGQPSQIMVFECVDDKVDAGKVSQLAGQYMLEHNIKLFIVSTKGYDNHTYATAKSRGVGLIQIDPSVPMTEICFVLSRSEASCEQKKTFWKMFEGNIDMTYPMIIVDGVYLGTSLLQVLKRYAISVIESQPWGAPMLSRKDIEKIAYDLIKDEAESFANTLRNIDYRKKGVPYCEISPYTIAHQRGIRIKRKNLSPMRQMANINMKSHEVTLNQKVGPYSYRERFSMGHEIGHDTLHALREKALANDGIPKELSSDEKRVMEQQANYFASCLLLPREMTRLMYEIYWKKEFHSDHVKPLAVDKQDYYSDGVFQRIIGPASRHLNVSMEALMYRLNDIGLVVFC